MLKHYLWKEWRDHRSILIGILVAVPFLLVICGLSLPTGVLADRMFAVTTAISCFFITVLSLGADVVPGEGRRGTLSFLRRLPAGLTQPLLAKVLLVAAALAGFTLYGYGTAAGVARVFAGGGAPLDPRILWIVPVAVALAAWVFVVSCWLPRGALAVPATALVLGLGLLPVYLLVSKNKWLVPATGPPLWPIWAFAAAAPFVAWFSFVGGQRYMRGVFASAWRGLLVTLLLFVPVWAATHHHAQTFAAFDPGRPLQIKNAVIGKGVRYAYLTVRNVENRRPQHAISVDLATGAWRTLGNAGDSVFRIVFTQRDRAPANVVAVQGVAKKGRYWCRYLDAATGREIAEGWLGQTPASVWQRMRRWSMELPEGLYARYPAGLGACVNDKRLRRDGLYDPFRKKMFLWDEVRTYSNIAVRPGLWIGSRNRKRVLFDPETMEESELRGVGRIVDLLSDGRVLTTDLETREVVVVDPETGARERCGLRTEGNKHQPGVYKLAGSVFRVQVDGRGRVARLDPKTLRFSYARGLDKDGPYIHFDLMAIVDENTVIGVFENNKLVRARFDSDELEVLFPR